MHGADVDITQWQGSFSGLLGRDDVDAVAAVMQPDSLTGINVYENVWEAQGNAPGTTPPNLFTSTQSGAAPAAAVGADDRLARLAQLGELRASGVLTEAEFEQQKALILAG